MSDRPTCECCGEPIEEGQTVVTEREGVESESGITRYHEGCR